MRKVLISSKKESLGSDGKEYESSCLNGLSEASRERTRKLAGKVSLKMLNVLEGDGFDASKVRNRL